MQSFVKHLVLKNFSFEVHFNEYYALYGIRYFVFARNLNGESYSFNMERAVDRWRIINAPGVNDLFVNNEKILSDVISDYERNESNDVSQKSK